MKTTFLQVMTDSSELHGIAPRHDTERKLAAVLDKIAPRSKQPKADKLPRDLHDQFGESPYTITEVVPGKVGLHSGFTITKKRPVQL